MADPAGNVMTSSNCTDHIGQDPDNERCRASGEIRLLPPQPRHDRNKQPATEQSYGYGVELRNQGGWVVGQEHRGEANDPGHADRDPVNRFLAQPAVQEVAQQIMGDCGTACQEQRVGR